MANAARSGGRTDAARRTWDNPSRRNSARWTSPWRFASWRTCAAWARRWSFSFTMKLSRAQTTRRIALVIVMIVIVVFAILAGGFAYSMKVETKLARNATWETELEWLGRSGVELAKYVLSQPGQSGAQYDALN